MTKVIRPYLSLHRACRRNRSQTGHLRSSGRCNFKDFLCLAPSSKFGRRWNLLHEMGQSIHHQYLTLPSSVKTASLPRARACTIKKSLTPRASQNVRRVPYNMLKLLLLRPAPPLIRIRNGTNMPKFRRRYIMMH